MGKFWYDLFVGALSAGVAGACYFFANFLLRARGQWLGEALTGTLPVRWLLDSPLPKIRIIIGATQRPDVPAASRRVSRADLECACEAYHHLKDRWPSKLPRNGKRLPIWDSEELPLDDYLKDHFEVVIGGPKRNSVAGRLAELLEERYEPFPFHFEFFRAGQKDRCAPRLRGHREDRPLQELRGAPGAEDAIEGVLGLLCEVRAGERRLLPGQPACGQPTERKAHEGPSREYLLVVKARLPPPHSCDVLWLAGTRGEANVDGIVQLLDPRTAVAAHLRRHPDRARDWAAALPIHLTETGGYVVTEEINLRSLSPRK